MTAIDIFKQEIINYTKGDNSTFVSLPDILSLINDSKETYSSLIKKEENATTTEQLDKTVS